MTFRLWPFHLRVTVEREPKPLIWKYGCKHGYPNFVRCPYGCDD